MPNANLIYWGIWEQLIVFQVAPPPACGEAAKLNIYICVNILSLYYSELTGAAVLRLNPFRPQ